MHAIPRYKYRISSKLSSFLKSVWSPNQTVFEVGGLEEVGERLGVKLDPKVDNKSVFDPHALFERLDRYFVPIKMKIDGQTLRRAVEFTRRRFELPHKVHRVKEKEVAKRLLKLDRNSGAPVFTSKLNAFEDDWNRSLAIATGEQAPPPCIALSRVQHGEEGPKVRLVWGYPQSMTILEAKYAGPLIHAYVCNGGLGVMPYLRRKMGLSAALTRFANRPLRYQIDYSGFDATVPVCLIEAAFNFFKEMFYDVDEQEWNAIQRYFTYTEILMPDGNVYRKKRGIPSGSYFTQLVGSFVNYAATMYAFLRLGVDLHPRNLMVLGDDSISAPDRAISLHSYAAVVAELGLKVNTEKSSISYGSDPIHFLGHYWPFGLPDRELEDILKRVRFPERFISTRMKPEERLAIFLADGISAWRIYNAWRRADVYGDIWRIRPRLRKYMTALLSGDAPGIHKVTGEMELISSERLMYAGVLL